MKKNAYSFQECSYTLLFIVCMILCVVPVPAQQISALQRKSSDIVVLLDNSGTMLPHFDTINNEILSEIADSFLRTGDTFHLISFNTKPLTEIVQNISTERDVRAIVSRFRLLYPLGQYSDFLGALKYTQQYINTLNFDTQKTLVIITDGIFNPSEASSSFGLDIKTVEEEITSITSRLKMDGVELYFMKIPFPVGVIVTDTNGEVVSGDELMSDGIQNMEKSISKEQKTYTDISSVIMGHPAVQTNGIPSVPVITYQSNLGIQFYTTKLPFSIENTSDESLLLQLDSVYIIVDDKTVDILDKPQFIRIKPQSKGEFAPDITFPKELKAKEQLSVSAQLVFADNARVNPEYIDFSVTLKKGIGFTSIIQSMGFTVLIVMCCLAALVLIVVIALLLNKISSKPHVQAVNRSFSASAASEKKAAIPFTTGDTTVQEVSIAQKPLKSNAKAPIGEPSSQIPSVPSVSATVCTPPPLLHTAAHISSTVSAKEEKTAVVEKTLLSPSIAVKNAQKDIQSFEEKQTARESQDILAQFSAKRERVRETAVHEAASMRGKISGGSNNAHMMPQIKTARRSLQREKITVTGNASMMLELFVYNQNTHIGKRNIHLLKPGSCMSLGGCRSDFLVFLVSFPARIAEIRYDGSVFTLAILQPQYFPYLETDIVEDCLNTDIILRSDKNYEVTFKLIPYEDPIIQLNKMLLSIVAEKELSL